MDKQISNEEEVTLKVLILKLIVWWRYLLSKWLIIVSSGIIFGSIGLVYSYYKEPVYTAELSFVLEEEKQDALGGIGGLAGQFGLDMGGAGGRGAFSGENLLALMKSRSMIERTLMTTLDLNNKSITLAEFFIEVEKIKTDSKAYFSPGSEPSKFSLEQNRLMSAIHGSIVNDYLSLDKLDPKSKITVVSVKSKNEMFSKHFAEAIVKVVTDFYTETKTKKSSENLSILQRQTDSVRNAYNSAIVGFAKSSDETPNLNPSRQVLRTPSLRKQFDVKANEVMLTQLIQNLEAAKISLRKDTPFIQIIDRPTLPLPKEEQSKVVGIVLGGIIGVFIAVFSLLVIMVIKETMA